MPANWLEETWRSIKRSSWSSSQMKWQSTLYVQWASCRRPTSQMISKHAADIVQYSVYEQDFDIRSCYLHFQKMVEFPKNIHHPIVKCLVPKHPVQSMSAYPMIWRDGADEKIDLDLKCLLDNIWSNRQQLNDHGVDQPCTSLQCSPYMKYQAELMLSI